MTKIKIIIKSEELSPEIKCISKFITIFNLLFDILVYKILSRFVVELFNAVKNIKINK